jgi:hypothetical protein
MKHLLNMSWLPRTLVRSFKQQVLISISTLLSREALLHSLLFNIINNKTKVGMKITISALKLS